MASPAQKQEILDGLKVTAAICIGYFPFGVAFGLLSQHCGLTPPMVALMSIVVYAGSAQLMAIVLLQSGQGFAEITLATAIVNLRYFLINGALYPAIKNWKFHHKILLSYFVSDETFAVLSERAS